MRKMILGRGVSTVRKEMEKRKRGGEDCVTRETVGEERNEE